MSKKQIVILGGGTGGTMTANRLRCRFEQDEAEIHAVDRDEQMEKIYIPPIPSSSSSSPTPALASTPARRRSTCSA